jgi:tetratricopeptide (TPR) repeat protein
VSPSRYLLAIIAVVPALAHAEDPDKASALYDQGVADYKAQNYEHAASTLKQAYELDHKPEYLFAWAQSERLSGDCAAAIPLYRKLTDEISDLGTARLVHDNLARCEQSEATAKPESGTKSEPVAETPVPTPVTTVRTSSADPVATALFIGGGLSIGLGVGMFVASSNSASAADHALTYDDHVAFADRASTQRTIAWVATGVGLGAVGYAIFRVVRGRGESAASTSVTFTHAPATGTAVMLNGRW